MRGVGERGFDRDFSAGVDVKAGVTPSLTLDVTVNPDFAQAEADEQQVNLTQFSLFFPEKREFFLENSGIFYFGDIPRNHATSGRFRPPEEDLLLVLQPPHRSDRQRRAGAAVRRRAAHRARRPLRLGVMTMQSKDDEGKPGSNYTVVRVRRDVFGSSDIGAIVLSREPSGDSDDFNRVAGVDANFRFFKSLSLNGFRRAVGHAGRDDESGRRQGVDRLGRQREARCRRRS